MTGNPAKSECSACGMQVPMMINEAWCCSRCGGLVPSPWDEADHPPHNAFRRSAPGKWDIAFPIHPSGLLGWKTRRQCQKLGGHWWHPSDPMIEWKCCACGASRDGIPGVRLRLPA